MPDIFESGYGNVYLPPPGITLNGESVGYDVYDRFNLGSPGETTLYGTQSQFEKVVQGIHTWGGDATVDLLWTWTNGINHSNNSNFSEFPGLTTVLQTTNPSGPGYNTLGYNSTTGDFYPTSDSNQDEEALAGLQHNDPASNYFLIRQPTTAGNPQNIPEGTGVWLGSTVANIPTSSNAQYYPDPNNVRYETFNGSTVAVSNFDPGNPGAGVATAENLTGYLMRYTQWMTQVMGVDGFRYDGGNNTYPWVMNYLDLATYEMSDRKLLDGSTPNVFTFSEVYTSNISTIEQYISKTALTNPAGTVGGDRDALDFPLYFAMTSNLSGNGAFGSGQNNWYNVVNAGLDYADDGKLNGSQGVKFVSDQDVPAPVLSNIAYAYTLMMPGNATVYYNGENFSNESSNSSGGEFPQGGASDSFDGALTALGGPYASQTGNYNLNPLGGGATTPNGNIASLVDLRNRFGRGDYREDWIEQNVYAFEREGSCIVLLSNATSATSDGKSDYDSRTFDTTFPVGTVLEEYTGNATSTFADPQQNIPEFVQVVADTGKTSATGAQVTVRVPRNVQYNSSTSSSYNTGDGYLVYGLPTPTGSLKLTNVASTLGGQTFSTSASNAGYLNGTETFSTISVIKTATFQLQLTTSAAYFDVSAALPNYYDQDADGDKAQFTIDGGALTVGPDGTVSTTPGSNGETTTPGDVSYGYQPFATSNPGYYSSDGNGSYSQTINTSQLGQGYHYIEVMAFRHNSDASAPPVYSDWYETVYVDTDPANSTVLSFNPASSTTNRTLAVESVDGLANNIHVLLDLPFGLTDSQVLADVSSSNQPTAGDVNQWSESETSVSSGNHTVTLVSYKPDGSYSIQRFSSSQLPFLSTTTALGAGLGDLDNNFVFNSVDIITFQTVLTSNNTRFNPAADINGDGYVDLSDAFLLGPVLVSHNASSATMTSYNNMLNNSYVTTGTYTVSGANTILQDTAGTTNLNAGASLVATYIHGNTLSLAAGTTVKIQPNGTSAATSKIASLSLAGSMGNWQSQIDLTNNDLIIDYAGNSDPLTTVQNMLAQGYDSGKWDGLGIMSSMAGTNTPLITLGYADTASFSLASLGGQALDSTSIVIKYTYVGDANLDGKVDASDLALMSSSGTTWTQGDFNYDGKVNADDYALFALGAAKQGVPLTQVPEPVSGFFLVFLGLAWGRRR
ncbi:MAG TPA: hypothetical protein VGG19_20355 [Tepidisphaeraceae bacterium]|jgi:hypothetical protein